MFQMLPIGRIGADAGQPHCPSPLYWATVLHDLSFYVSIDLQWQWKLKMASILPKYNTHRTVFRLYLGQVSTRKLGGQVKPASQRTWNEQCKTVGWNFIASNIYTDILNRPAVVIFHLLQNMRFSRVAFIMGRNWVFWTGTEKATGTLLS